MAGARKRQEGPLGLPSCEMGHTCLLPLSGSMQTAPAGASEDWRGATVQLLFSVQPHVEGAPPTPPPPHPNSCCFLAKQEG